MAKPIEVSVVITCYNYGKYLSGCIESVMAQTFKGFEIIVVDDGSNDNTYEVMRQFNQDSRVLFVKQENRGQASAKNAGIKNSSGKYIAFLDADDQWERLKLEKQMALFSRDSVGVVFSRAIYIDEGGKELDFQFTGKYQQPHRGRVTDFLFLDNFVAFSSSVLRRECLDKCGVFDESLKMGIDWDLWLRISTQYEFDYVDERLLIYRIGHSGQMSKNLEEHQRCSDRIMEKFLNKYPFIVSTSTMTKAMTYTYCNRGEYYRKINRWRSTCYFLKTLKMNPVNIDAHKGLIKNILFW